MPLSEWKEKDGEFTSLFEWKAKAGRILSSSIMLCHTIHFGK
jgi:hypothetical protein